MKKSPAYHHDEVQKDLAYMINQNYEERKRPACSSGEGPPSALVSSPLGHVCALLTPHQPGHHDDHAYHDHPDNHNYHENQDNHDYQD